MKTLLIVFLLLITTQAQEPPSLEDTFREALYAEEVDGDPEAALQSYRQLNEQFQKQRTLAARTLFRQAECLRKLDRNDEAITTYQTLLTRYPENERLTQLAQENLLALGHTPASSPDTPAPLDPEDQKIAELKKLLQESPDLLDRGPLREAAQNGHLKVAQFLIDSGADISTGQGADSPLAAAAWNGHKAMCELLVENGADLKIDGPYCLHGAIENNYQKIIQFLLSTDTPINLSHLVKAIQSSDPLKILSLIFDQREDTAKELLNQTDLIGSPLYRACKTNGPTTIQVVTFLLEKGADPNLKRPSQKNQESPTPLDSVASNFADACASNNGPEKTKAQTLLNLLTEAGADWKETNLNNLGIAIDANSPSLLQQILKDDMLSIAHQDAVDSLIDLAATYGKHECLKVLIDGRASVPTEVINQLLHSLLVDETHSNSSQTTLLKHFQNLMTCLDICLAAKPELNKRVRVGNQVNQTPLQLLTSEAFFKPNPQALPALEKLLAAGADPNYGPPISHQAPQVRRGPSRGQSHEKKRNDTLPLALLLYNSLDPKTAPAIRLLLEKGADPKLLAPFPKSFFCTSDGKVRGGAKETFPELWQTTYFDPASNFHRPNGLWLSQGLTALQQNQDPTFRCLLSKESAAVPTTLKDFVHRANLESDRALDLFSDRPLLIHRLDQAEPTSILFREHLASGNDFPLQWGDIIEIPARPLHSELPDDAVTSFLQSPHPIDLNVTLGDNQILTNAENTTDPIFRYQPKSPYDTIERVRIAAGIPPFFLTTPQILRPNPETGELISTTPNNIALPGDHIHFAVAKPRPGPVTHSPNTGKLCQDLDGPFWEIFTNQGPGQSGILPSNTITWLPHQGLASYLLALAQPHGLPLQPIDWQQSHVSYRNINTAKEGKQYSLQDFFSSPPHSQPNPSFIIVLPPAKEHTPFPEDLKKLLTDTLSTSWSLKIGMEDPIEQQWSPHFPTFTQKEDKIIWQAPLPEQQTVPALPLVPDLLEAHSQVQLKRFETTLFPSRKLIRIEPSNQTNKPQVRRVRKSPQN